MDGLRVLANTLQSQVQCGEVSLLAEVSIQQYKTQLEKKMLRLIDFVNPKVQKKNLEKLLRQKRRETEI